MQNPAQQSWKGRRVKISAVKSAERHNRMREAVARRAYQFFSSRGCVCGHELEDWRRAESDVVGPLGCGLTVWDDKISLTTDLSIFDAGVVEVCVEPRQLSICGKPCAGTRAMHSDTHAACPPVDFVYRVLTLPVEVDPSQSATKFRGRILEINLRKAPSAQWASHTPNAA